MRLLVKALLSVLEDVPDMSVVVCTQLCVWAFRNLHRIVNNVKSGINIMRSYNIDQQLSHVWFLSFADSRLLKPRERLLRQALAFGFSQDHIRILDEHNLSESFNRAMSKHLVLGTRGFGYWCWKPEIILRALENIQEGDILFYCDIGCHLNCRGKERFYDYLDVARAKGFLGFQSRSLVSTASPNPQTHIRTTAQYTKGDILDFFQVRNVDEITQAAQVLGGIVFFKKSKQALDLVKQWKDLYVSNFHLADDSPSVSNNLPGFIENRHDQALLSVLWLKKRLPTVSSCEVELLRRHLPPQIVAGPEWGGWWFWQNKQFPIHARRDMGQSFSIFKKLYYYFRTGKFYFDLKAHIRSLVSNKS